MHQRGQNNYGVYGSECFLSGPHHIDYNIYSYVAETLYVCII